MIAVISSEYSLQTCSPVKYVESAAIADEISAFLAKGGQIKQCEQRVVVKQRVRKKNPAKAVKQQPVVKEPTMATTRRNNSIEAVYRYIRDNQDTTRNDIAAALGLSGHQIYDYLKVLQETGRIYQKARRCMPSLYNVVEITSTQQLVEKYCN